MLGQALRRLGLAVGGTVTFALAAAGGVVLHAGSPPARRFIVKTVNDALAQTFQGTLTIGRVDRIGWDGVSAARATIYGADGKSILDLEDVQANIDAVSAVTSVLFGTGPMVLNITRVRARHFDWVLAQDDTGHLTIERAFNPRAAPATAPPPPSATAPAHKGRDLQLYLRDVVLGSGSIHIAVRAFPTPFDVDVRGLAGSFSDDHDVVTIDVPSMDIDAHGFLQHVDPRGHVAGHVRVPSTVEGQMFDGGLVFDGWLAGQRSTSSAFVLGPYIKAVVDTKAIDPETLAAAISPSPLREPAALHAEASGILPDVVATAHVAVGPGTVDVTATGRLESALLATVNVAAKNIDLHSLLPTSLHSDLSATTTASVRIGDGAIDGRFAVDGAPSVLAGQLIPGAELAGQFTGDRVFGHAKIDEPGAPTDVDFDLHTVPGAVAPVVDFKAEVRASDLGRVPRLGHAVTGAVRAQASGRLAVDGLRLDAHGHVAAQHLAAGGLVRVSAGNADFGLHGPIANLSLETSIGGTGLVIAGRELRTFEAKTSGTLAEIHVTAAAVGENAPDVHLRARVLPGSTTTIDQLALTLDRKDVRVLASARRIRIGSGGAQVEGVEIEGLSETPARADLTVAGGAIALDAKGTDLDLARVGRLLDVEGELQGGRVSLDMNVTSSSQGPRGKVVAKLAGGKFPYADGADGRLEVSFDGRRLKADIRSSLAPVGQVTVTADDLVLGGGLLAASSWRSAVGHATIAGDVDLAKAAAMLPAGLLPVAEAAGRVTLKGTIGRAQAGALPDVDAEVSTKGLVLVSRPPYESRGNDVALAVHVKGSSRATTLTARIFDKNGDLLEATAKGAPAYRQIWGAPDHGLEGLLDLPIEVHAVLPTRPLDELPELAEARGLRGLGYAAVDLEGTLRSPRARVMARAFGLTPDASPHATLFNAEVRADYENGKATLEADVARPDALVAKVTANAKVAIPDLRKGGAGPIAWEASGAALLAKFPLDMIPLVAGHRTHGDVSGTVTLDGLHRDAKLDVKLDVSDVRVAQARYKSGTLVAHTEGGALTASGRLDQTDGFAETHATGGVTWGAALLPTLDSAKPLVGTLQARNFRLKAIQPFLGESVSELDGRLDSDSKVTYDLGNGKRSRLEGSLDLRDGILEIPNAGGEFHAIRARITMNPLGTFHIDDVSADGATGRLTGSGTLALSEFRFQDAALKIHIAKREKMPISAGGVPMGTAWGDIEAKASLAPDGHGVVADVTLPKLYVDLPQSTGHSVQSLDPDPDVAVGFRESGARFTVVELAKPAEARPATATRTHVAFHFGNEVWVTRGSMLKLQLRGGPVIDITDKVHVSGQILATAGTIEVQSKKFEIDRAAVSFVSDDPSDPQVVASAHWQAPSKTTVTVDVTGTAEKLKLAFHSSPELPQDAILSLILFGDENGSLISANGGSGDSADVNGAAGLAGGVVAQGVNKAISGITTVDVTTRLDTSQSQNPRPEIALQLTRDVSATFSYNLGLPAPGQNPDLAQLIVDYRFVHNWSVLATLGDVGSTILDLLWQYRY